MFTQTAPINQNYKGLWRAVVGAWQATAATAGSAEATKVYTQGVGGSGPEGPYLDNDPSAGSPTEPKFLQGNLWRADHI